MSSCGHLVKKCLGEEVRPSAGLCMIAFAVPLIVPGITLTVVAFEDQSGFPKYGALHVLGMILLGLAVLFIASGILLNTRAKTKVVSDDVQLMESNKQKSAKDNSTNKCVTSSADEYHHTSSITTSGFTSKLPSYNSVVNLADNSTEGYQELKYTTAEVNAYSDPGQTHVALTTRKHSKRKCSSSKSVDDCSSSFDSFDSDNFSSGSYILSENLEGQKADFSMGYVHENDDVRLFSTFKPNEAKKQVFSFDNISGDCIAGESSSFIQPAVDNEAFISKSGSEDNFANRMALVLGNINKLPLKARTTGLPPTCTSELPVEASSPGSRQRLHGLSSEAFTSSSDMLTRSSDSLKIQDVSNDNISASSSSVFSLGLAVKCVTDSAQGDRTETVVFAQGTTPLPHKTWAQSPTTSRPHSFPCGGGITGLSEAVIRIHSLNDTYVPSLGEFAR
ncbi:hypothetical protein BsWGS_21009 [Bradybaena similaris]